MTIAGRRPATELGLRPASRADSSQRTPSGRIVPILLFLIAMAIGLARIAGPASDLYPIEGDSAKYSEIAQGFATLYSHPLDGLGLWFSHRATTEDLKRFHFDNWVLQHAPAYTAFLGVGYLVTGGDVTSGRVLTVFLFAIGAVFLYLIAREFFGKWPALLAGALFVLWPANWEYAPAILTEIPVTTAALFASYVLLRTMRSEDRRAWILGGVAITLLVLTKTPIRFVTIPWIAVEALIDRTGGLRRVLTRAGYRLGGAGALWAVWVIFLWGFHLSPNPLGQSGDDWLWIYRGNYVPDRGWELVGIGDPYTPELIQGSQEAQGVSPDREKGEMYKRAFFGTLDHYPGGMATLMLTKAGIFWRYPAVKTYKGLGPISLPPPARVQPTLAIAALLCLALSIGAHGRRWIPAVFPIYLTFLHAATHLVSRYNAPAVPFAMIYAPGALAILLAAARREIGAIRSGARAVAARCRPLAIPAGIAIVALLLSLILLRVGEGPRPRSLDRGGGSATDRLARLRRPGARSRSRPRLPPPAGAGGECDARGRLSPRTDARPPGPGGEGVRTHLRLPADIDPKGFNAGEILLDILPSARGEMTLSVRLNGSEVARFDGRPPSSADAFLLDPQVHAAEDRYRKVLKSVDRNLNDFVRRHRGMENAGYDYYRQWYRVPVDPALAFAGRDVTIEIVLTATRGGSCDVFVDRDAAMSADSREGRSVRMPAFFENPYELSSYRFDALASDRLLADSRLARSIPLASDQVGAERVDAGGAAHPLPGEPRIRLRGRVPGGYGLIQRSNGGAQPAWVTDPAKAVRMLTPDEIRVIEADRDHYFDGYVVF